MILRKETGELLFDTDKIVYGLVKSAYLALGEKWGRYNIRAANVDPNLGSSWVKQDDSVGEQMYTITVPNARSPIVFLVGKGVLQGSVTSGSSITFIYSAASTATKAYVFDLMSDDISGSPYVKTRSQITGQITFNSLQPALNIAGAVQAPPPPPQTAGGYYVWAYDGSRWDVIQTGGTSSPQPFIAHNIMDIALTAGVEYAAYCPFSRGANGIFPPGYTGTGNLQLGLNEGAYGRVGGISFIFSTAGATVQRTVSSSVPTPQITGLPLTGPQALIVNTDGLPFPFQ